MSAPPPRLVAHWYAKLRASGFEDIETPDGRLKGSDEQRQSDAEASWSDRDAIERYFELAGRFMHSRRYAALHPIRRKVWGLHCSGASNAEVARIVGTSLKTVRVAIRACRTMAGLPAVTATFGHGRPVE